MRGIVALICAALLLACGPATEPSDAPSAQPAAEGFTMETEALVGVWSFDRTCASSDGMSLRADGTASFDEWGEGTWATADGNRVILSLERYELGVGPTGESVTYHLDVVQPVTEYLAGELVREDGTEP